MRREVLHHLNRRPDRIIISRCLAVQLQPPGELAGAVLDLPLRLRIHAVLGRRFLCCRRTLSLLDQFRLSCLLFLIIVALHRRSQPTHGRTLLRLHICH